MVRWGAAGLLLALAGYGVFSFPGLAARWNVTATAGLLLLGWIFLAVLGWQCARKDRMRPGTCAILLMLVIASRAAMWALFDGHQAGGDAYCYPQIAQNLLAGKGYVIDDPHIGPGLRALFPPAYATLLAAWGFVAGFSTLSYTVLNLILDGSSALLLSRLGRRLGFSRAGNAAAWLYLIWPSLLLSSALAQKESLISLLVLLLAHYWITPSRPASHWRDALALGVPTGLLALVQPNLSLLSALMGAMFLFRDGFARLGRRAAAGLIAAVLVMVPWWVRNWMVFGAFVPLTTSAGVSLWIGNNPGATGNWMPPPSFPGLAERAYMAKVSAMALAWIQQNPFDFIRLTATKFVRATAVAITGLVRMEGLTPPLAAGLAALFLPVSQVVHSLLLALSGIVVGRAKFGESGGPLLALLAACGLQLGLFCVWFEFSERHCQFMLSFLLLLLCVAAIPKADAKGRR